eukprot:gene8446-10375_t
MTVGNWYSKREDTDMVPRTVQILGVMSNKMRPSEFTPGCFPSTLTELNLWTDYHFNIDVPFVPEGIKKLTFVCYGYFPPGFIPSSVEELNIKIPPISPYQDDFLPGMIPHGVKELYLESGRVPFMKDSIPETVSKLILRIRTHHNSTAPTLENEMVPSSLALKYIDIKGVVRQPSYFPSLYYLKCDLTRISKGTLPPTLVEGTLPMNLSNLTYIFPSSTSPFPFIPKLVKSLSIKIPPTSPLIDSTYSIEIPIGSLPDSLEYFEYHCHPDLKLGDGILPNNLKTLRLYHDNLEYDGVPLNLSFFKIPPSYRFISDLSITITENNADVFESIILNSTLTKSLLIFRVLVLYPRGSGEDQHDSEGVLVSILERVAIPAGALGPSLKEFELLLCTCYDSYRLDIDPVKIPKTVIERGSIPSSVERLKIDYIFIQDDPVNFVPSSVWDLEVHYWSLKKGVMVQAVPATVRKLKIDCRSTKRMFSEGWLESLPSASITDIELVGRFPQLSKSVLPGSVKTLKYKTKGKDGPRQLYSVINNDFRNLVNIDYEVLPESLVHLETSSYLVSTLTLQLSSYFTQFSFEAYPSNSFPVIPTNVKILKIATKITWRKYTNITIPKGSLPDSIEYLHTRFNPTQKYNLDILPAHLKELHLINCISMDITSDIFANFQIPPSTTRLVLSSVFEISNFNYSSNSITIISKLLSRLFSNSESRLSITVCDTEFISFDRNDHYLQFKFQKNNQIKSGFLLKSNLDTFLTSINQF